MILIIALSTSENIALCSVIVAAIAIIVGIILHFWPKKENGNHKVQVEIHPIGPDDALVSKAMEVAEAKGRAEQEIANLKGELAKAVERIRKLEVEGKRPDAARALQELRKSGDMSRLQELLIKDRDEHRDALIQRNREITAVAYLRGEIDVAIEAVDEILKFHPEDLFAINQRGNIHKLRGELDEGEDCYQRVLELAIATNNNRAQAAALGNLGLVYRRRGELDKAEEMLQKTLEIMKKIGNQKGIASAYGNLGLIYRGRGELDNGEAMLQKTLEIMKKIGNQEGIGRACDNLGLIYRDRGDLRKAREYWEKARALYKRIGLDHRVKRVQGWIDGASDKGEIDERGENS